MRLNTTIHRMFVLHTISSFSLAFPPPSSLVRHPSRSSLQRRLAHSSVRVDRLLSNRGVASRSQVARLIKTRRVTTPDGEVVPSPKLKFDESQAFLVDGVESTATPLLLAFNKPRSVLSSASASDFKGRETLSAYLPPPGYGPNLFHPVGRLDYDTSGLLLLSSSGPLTHNILSPRSGVGKVYSALVNGLVPDPSALSSRLSSGVETSEGVHVAELLGCDRDEGGDATTLLLRVTEGKHRMVRRMCFNALKGDMLDPNVKELERVSVGEVELGDLEVGAFRELTELEAEWARELLKPKFDD